MIAQGPAVRGSDRRAAPAPGSVQAVGPGRRRRPVRRRPPARPATCCYELHYRGFAGVAAGWEWDPDLLRLRAALEDALPGRAARRRGRRRRRRGRDRRPAGRAGRRRRASRTTCGDEGELWQLREYVAHRSLYHLKEADPHAWVIPRLHGRAKAAMVAVEFDEFGAGRRRARCTPAVRRPDGRPGPRRRLRRATWTTSRRRCWRWST